MTEFFQRTHVPTVVLACNSNPTIKPPAIDPVLVNDLSDKFGAKLVELTTTQPSPAPMMTTNNPPQDKLRGILRETFQYLLRTMAQGRIQQANLDLGYANHTIHRHHDQHHRHHHHHFHHHYPYHHFLSSHALGTPSASHRGLALGVPVSGCTILDPLVHERMAQVEQAAGPGPEARSISEFLASLPSSFLGINASSSSEDSDSVPDDEVGTGERMVARPESEANSMTGIEPDYHGWGCGNQSSYVSTSTTSLLSATTASPEHAAKHDDMGPLLDLTLSSFPYHPTPTTTAQLQALQATPGSRIPLARTKKASRAREPVYVPLTELLHRFFLAIVGNTDPNYVDTILVFYRAFAPPELLLDEFVRQFDLVAGGGLVVRSSEDQVEASEALVRLVRGFHTWIVRFPGDLSPGTMFPILRAFHERITNHPSTTSVATDLQLEAAMRRCASSVDWDLMWSTEACPTLLTNSVSNTEIIPYVSNSVRARHET